MKATIGVLILVALALACCSSQGGDACDGVDCGLGGYCEETSDGWTCICYEEYYPKIDGKCYARKFDCGQECKDDGWCESSKCFRPLGYEFGYCTMYGCSSHDDCSYCYDAPFSLCCIESRNDTLCTGILDGFECGDQSGGCGDSCAGQLDSACMPGLFCMRSSEDDPDAFCSMSCESDEDCVDCGTASVCREASNGFTYCQPEEGA